MLDDQKDYSPFVFGKVIVALLIALLLFTEANSTKDKIEKTEKEAAFELMLQRAALDPEFLKETLNQLQSDAQGFMSSVLESDTPAQETVEEKTVAPKSKGNTTILADLNVQTAVFVPPSELSIKGNVASQNFFLSSQEKIDIAESSWDVEHLALNAGAGLFAQYSKIEALILNASTPGDARFSYSDWRAAQLILTIGGEAEATGAQWRAIDRGGLTPFLSLTAGRFSAITEKHWAGNWHHSYEVAGQHPTFLSEGDLAMTSKESFRLLGGRMEAEGALTYGATEGPTNIEPLKLVDIRRWRDVQVKKGRHFWNSDTVTVTEGSKTTEHLIESICRSGKNMITQAGKSDALTMRATNVEAAENWQINAGNFIYESASLYSKFEESLVREKSGLLVNSSQSERSVQESHSVVPGKIAVGGDVILNVQGQANFGAAKIDIGGCFKTTATDLVFAAAPYYAKQEKHFHRRTLFNDVGSGYIYNVGGELPTVLTARSFDISPTTAIRMHGTVVNGMPGWMQWPQAAYQAISNTESFSSYAYAHGRNQALKVAIGLGVSLATMGTTAPENLWAAALGAAEASLYTSALCNTLNDQRALSKQDFKNAAVAGAGTGITHALTEGFGLNIEARKGFSGFGLRFEQAGCQVAGSTTAQVVIGGEDLASALKTNARLGLSQSLGASLAGEIKAFENDYLTHKLLHGANGALMGTIANSDALSGAFGSAFGEIVGESIKDIGLGATGVYASQLATLMGGWALDEHFHLGLDPSISAMSAGTSVAHNSLGTRLVDIDLEGLPKWDDTEAEPETIRYLVDEWITKKLENTSFSEFVETVGNQYNWLAERSPLVDAFGNFGYRTLKLMGYAWDQGVVGGLRNGLKTIGVPAKVADDVTCIFDFGSLALPFTATTKPQRFVKLAESFGQAERFTQAKNALSLGPKKIYDVRFARYTQGVYEPRGMLSVLAENNPGKAIMPHSMLQPGDIGYSLAGRIHPVSGVGYTDRCFPIFDPWTVYETKISYEMFSTTPRNTHFKSAMKDLSQSFNGGSLTRGHLENMRLKYYAQRDGFSLVDAQTMHGTLVSEEVDKVVRGIERIRYEEINKWFTFHHHEDLGRLQLVVGEVHDSTRHVGAIGLIKKQLPAAEK